MLNNTTDNAVTPKSVLPGEGRKNAFMGSETTQKLSAADTGGLFHLAEIFVNPGGGPPPHVHSREDELFYVLEGEIDLEVAGRRYTGRPGALAYLPRGVAHRFGNSGSTPARMLGLITPPEFAGFLQEGARLAAQPGFHPTDLAALSAQYGVAMGAQGESAGPRGQTPVISGPGEGDRIVIHREEIFVKLNARETAGELGAFDLIVPPCDGPPLHVHDACDEAFYVLEGDFLFRANGADYYARTGSTVFIPRGAVHQFRNIGNAPGRLFAVVTPGGFEGVFARLRDAIDAGALTSEETARIGKEFQSRCCSEAPRISPRTVNAISDLRRAVAGTTK